MQVFRVKFLSGAGMVCYGTLQANGTEEEHVLFTSKQPTPLPGDWDNIELYGENNVISYVVSLPQMASLVMVQAVLHLIIL